MLLITTWVVFSTCHISQIQIFSFILLLSLCILLRYIKVLVLLKTSIRTTISTTIIISWCILVRNLSTHHSPRWSPTLMRTSLTTQHKTTWLNLVYTGDTTNSSLLIVIGCCIAEPLDLLLISCCGGILQDSSTWAYNAGKDWVYLGLWMVIVVITALVTLLGGLDWWWVYVSSMGVFGIIVKTIFSFISTWVNDLLTIGHCFIAVNLTLNSNFTKAIPI